MKNALREEWARSAPAQGPINDAQTAEFHTALSKAKAKLAVQAKETPDNTKLLQQSSQQVDDDVAEKEQLFEDNIALQEDLKTSQQKLGITESNFWSSAGPSSTLFANRTLLVWRN